MRWIFSPRTIWSAIYWKIILFIQFIEKLFSERKCHVYTSQDARNKIWRIKLDLVLKKESSRSRRWWKMKKSYSESFETTVDLEFCIFITRFNLFKKQIFPCFIFEMVVKNWSPDKNIEKSQNSQSRLDLDCNARKTFLQINSRFISWWCQFQ